MVADSLVVDLDTMDTSETMVMLMDMFLMLHSEHRANRLYILVYSLRYSYYTTCVENGNTSAMTFAHCKAISMCSFCVPFALRSCI